MYKSRILGAARLEVLAEMDHISFSDICRPTGTISFVAFDGFLSHTRHIFKLLYPGYEFEVWTFDGKVHIRRNGYQQTSPQYLGNGPCRVFIMWDVHSIACSVFLPPTAQELASENNGSLATPMTLPPAELVRLLRTENLLKNSAYLDAGDVFSTVVDCLSLCEADIRRHGLEKSVWVDVGDQIKPIAEPEISRLVATLLSSHGAIRNFDVTCESIAGSGKVDFYVIAPVTGGGLARIPIEAKKAESSKFVHGFQTQLPEYMARIGTNYGVYLIYWLKSPRYPYPPQVDSVALEIETLRSIPRSPCVRVISLNLSFEHSPSKQKAK